MLNSARTSSNSLCNYHPKSPNENTRYSPKILKTHKQRDSHAVNDSTTQMMVLELGNPFRSEKKKGMGGDSKGNKS